MRKQITRIVTGAVAAALALTSFGIEPVRAAPAAASERPVVGPAQSASLPTDISSRRRVHRGGNPAAAIAMFGVVAGTIAAISASRRHRYNHGYYYPYGGYGPAYPYYGPRPYAYPYYGPPPGYPYW
ncbi:MAG TPA: hypothetical protein VNR11_22240 [Xanthobacteraceae bacterium]|nr:hypothetical protein [Xanthobacteraceae bacterium]